MGLVEGLGDRLRELGFWDICIVCGGGGGATGGHCVFSSSLTNTSGTSVVVVVVRVLPVLLDMLHPVGCWQTMMK